MLPDLLAGRRRAVFARLVANGLAQAVAAVAAALLLRAALNEARSGAGVAQVMPAAAALCVAGLAMWGLRQREAVDAERLAQSYIKSVRLALFGHVNAVPSRVMQRRTRGVMMVRFVADLNAIGLWVGRGVAKVVTAAPAALAALGGLAWVSPAVGVGVAAVVALGGAASALLVPVLYRRTRLVRRRRGQLAANLGEILAAATPVQVLGRAAGEGERMGEQVDRLARATTSWAGVAGAARALPDAAVPAAAAGALLLLVATEPGAAAASSLAAVILLLGLLAASIRDLSRAVVYRQGFRAARDVLNGFLALPRLPGGASLQPGPGRLEFDGVTVKGSLQEVTATAEPRQVVALGGPSGAGKSSLLALASRLFDPDAGEVRLDGQRLADLDPESLRRRVGVVSPDLPLLRGSLGRNLRYQAPHASRDALRAVIALCGLTEAVAALPKGLDTRLAEAGVELPAGLRRRVALARAVLAEPTLLLVDDADAFVDPDSRAALDRVIARRGSTVLLVTHDPARAAQADAVWLLKEGRLEAGPPDGGRLAAEAPVVLFRRRQDGVR